jgi:carbamoyltransferase
MNILGIGGLLDDAACAVVSGGEIRAAIEEKKLARRMQPGELPEQSIRKALQLARMRPEAVEAIALARPFSPAEGIRYQTQLRAWFPSARLAVVDHHEAHAVSAFACSAFGEATVLVLDSGGDFRSNSLWHATKEGLRMQRESCLPDSLGDLYSRITELLGFEAGADEHKVQWLALSGDARYADLLREVVGGKGWPRVDARFFDGERESFGGWSPLFYQRLELEDEANIPESMKPHLAAAVQIVVEECAVAMAGGGENLCLAGGVAFNASLVRAFEVSGNWRNVFVQPAAGNAGTALGAALSLASDVHPLKSLALGPEYTAEETKQVLENCKLSFRLLPTMADLLQSTVDELTQNRIVAWMQGRMEFGPRALGYRSILASPLDPYSTENLNAFIKRRESFRKFAASVPAELAAQFFECTPNARFLATLSQVRPEYRSRFEAAVLGDGLVRVHAVREDENPLFHRLLHLFGRECGLPVLFNTSFNLFGDPLVCSPRDAVRSFFSSGIDALFAGQFLIRK